MKSDAELIGEILEGSSPAFEEIVLRYQSMMFRTVSAHVPRCDVETVSHDAFVRGYRALAKFRGEGPLGSWLKTIGLRECCDYWRRKRGAERNESALNRDEKRQLRLSLAGEALSDLRREDERAAAQSLLARALLCISAEDRVLLGLIYFEDLALSDAAKQLGWSLVKTKVRAFRARQKLKQFIEEMPRDVE